MWYIWCITCDNDGYITCGTLCSIPHISMGCIILVCVTSYHITCDNYGCIICGTNGFITYSMCGCITHITFRFIKRNI